MPTTDPTFYRTPRAAATAAPENFAYVAAFDPAGRRRTPSRWSTATPARPAMAAWSDGPSCRRPETNSTISAGTPARARCATRATTTQRPGAALPLVPGIRSSRSTSSTPSPTRATRCWSTPSRPTEWQRKAGYTRPHTVHCGPGGHLHVARWAAPRRRRPRRVALLDHDTFEVSGQWEPTAARSIFAYDFWWHLRQDTVITSEWATPSMIENGLDPEDLLGRKFGHHLNFWSMSDAQADPARRPRRPAPDGARTAPGPRPDQVLRLRRRRDQCRGSVRVGVDVAQGRRPVGGRQGRSPSPPSRPMPTSFRRS